MSYILPDWLAIDINELRIESGLLPHQLVADGDDESMNATIVGHIATSAARVLGEARTAARSLSFPSTEAELLKAYPIKIDFPVLHAWDATDGEMRMALGGVKSDAYSLWIPGYVAVSFPFQIGNPDDLDHGQVQPTQETVTAAVEAAQVQRANQIEEQKQLVIQAVTSLVIAKLWYSCGPPDSEYSATASGHWKTAMSLVGTLKTNVAQIHEQYFFNACPFV